MDLPLAKKKQSQVSKKKERGKEYDLTPLLKPRSRAKRRMNKNLSPEEIVEVILMRSSGKTWAETAAALDLSFNQLYRWWTNANFEKIPVNKVS